MKSFFVIIFLVVFIPSAQTQNQSNSRDTIFLTNGKTLVCTVVGVSKDDVMVVTGKGMSESRKSIDRSMISRTGITTDLSWPPRIDVVRSFDSSSAEQKPLAWNKNTPGRQLQIFAQNWYVGASLNLLGLGLVMAGSYTVSSTKPVDKDYEEKLNGGGGLIIGGGIVSLIGSIFILESFSHVIKAGRLLDEQSKVGIVIPKDMPGLGICYKL